MTQRIVMADDVTGEFSGVVQDQLNATIAEVVASEGVSHFAPLDAATFPWPQGLIAFWDFHEAAGSSTLTTVAGLGRITATALGSGTFTKDALDPGPFGPSLHVDKSTAYLVQPAGLLDLSRFSDEFTVIAWVKEDPDLDDSRGIAFRGGSHIEGNTNPARQYGLYFDAAYYGGDRRLSPHLGAQDGATPGKPYNADYAVNPIQYNVRDATRQWHMEAATYDGAQIIAYLDGIATLYPSYTEPDDGVGTIRTIAKNPYPIKKGMNRSATSKVFSLFSALVRNGSGVFSAVNGTSGKFGGFAVFNRALTAGEIMRIRLGTLLPGEPIFRRNAETELSGANAASTLGYTSYVNALGDQSDSTGTGMWRVSGVLGSRDFFVRTGSASSGVILDTSISGLRSSQLKKITGMMKSTSDASPFRLVVKIGSTYYATDQTFSCVSNHTSTDDAGAEPFTFAFNHDASAWRALTVTPPGGGTIPTTVRSLATNPSFEVSGGYSSDAGTGGVVSVTRPSDAPNAFVGTYSYLQTWTTGTSAASGGGRITAIEDCAVGSVYAYSVRLKASKAQRVLIRVTWLDSGGITLRTDNGTSRVVAADTWEVFSMVTGSAPTGAKYGRLEWTTSTGSGGVAWNASDTMRIDGYQVTEGATVHDLFFGGYNGGTWVGTANASASTKTLDIPASAVVTLGSVLTSDIEVATLTAVGLFSDSASGTIRVYDVEYYDKP